MNRVVTSIVLGTVGLLIGIVAFSSGQSKTANSTGSSTASRAVVGDRAPDFTLPATDGRTISLADYRSKQHVLLYFHEGLTCQPCVDQVAELQKIQPQLEGLEVAILSVALDNVNDQKQALDRAGATSIPSLSYENAGTEVAYDLTRFSMGMGRRAGHTFILVDTAGVIQWRKEYWPGNGHAVKGGTMFVSAEEILTNVQAILTT